jgi:hypothetical protein
MGFKTHNIFLVASDLSDTHLYVCILYILIHVKSNDILFKILLQYASRNNMPKKAVVVEPGKYKDPPSFKFEAGKYKSMKMEMYLEKKLDAYEVQEDITFLREHPNIHMKLENGKLVQGRYGKAWYDCRLLHEIEGGWFVEWCDKDTKDRHKKTADIRLKRVEPKKRHSYACRWFWELPFKCALCNEEYENKQTKQ